MVVKGLNKKLANFTVIGIAIFAICFLIYIFAKNYFTKDEIPLVQIGYVENTKTYTGYLVKEETVVEYDYSKASMPVISEGQRTAKGQTIAVYKGSGTLEKDSKLAEMDAEILQEMQNLPEVYSSEVQSMNLDILNNIKSVEEETSYAKLQDAKIVVNGLLNKRALSIAENSPQGKTVREKIAARNVYENTTKQSSENIKAGIGGIVSYKLDGLENAKAFNNLGAISFSDIKEKLKSEKVSNGIKIVNNYEAYILIEVKDVDKKYLEAGKINKLSIVGLKNVDIDATIYRVREIEDGKYEVMYRISNKIEELAGLREIEVQVVWVSSYGMYVPNEAVKLLEEVPYVTVLSYGENVKVPVEIKRKNEKYSLIDNISDRSEIKGTWENYNIKVFDQLVIDKNDKKTT